MSAPIDLDNDVDLLIKLKKGDQSAFNILYKKYWSYVFDSSYKRVRDTALAEDITHDVFIQLWNIPKTTLISNFKGYLYVSVRNRVFRVLQQQSRFVPIEDVINELDRRCSQSSDAELLFKELTHSYAALILDLTEQQQMIYDLKYAQDFSPDEIAERLNLSPKTVRNQIGKINFKLRSSLLAINVIIYCFLK
ncbi:RNA polymerase sigma factor [Pedobacter frigidisoli]|uniref:RNA polymerase sigma factor n=1 Tax=Pedobacter frigidisoli TaxID=2530455 RepID=UPI00292D9AF6|nr:sigma-70 family RNA polymerase sigma factor [Pedobacter frigidisoli]